MLALILAPLLSLPPCPALGAAPACEGALPLYANGCATEWICPADLEAKGLTRIDLSDQWVPFIFQEAPELGDKGKQPYRPIYQKLAAGEVDDDAVESRAAVDRFFETYGIFPDLSLVRTRLLDEARHVCHDGIDKTWLKAHDKVVSAYEDAGKQRKRIRAVNGFERRFRRELTKRFKAENPDAEVPEFGPADFERLADEERWAWGIKKWRKRHVKIKAIHAAQQHLVCEGLMKRIRSPGLYDHRTFPAVQAYQRKHMLGSRSHLDAETRAVMIEDSRELDFRALLRALRERVVAASGLIEDGSALGERGTVFGRQLDTAEYRHPLPDLPLPNGAPDAISPATEAAAKALGWTSPEITIERLKGMQDLGQLIVALKLPPPPAWHAKHMELRAEIDRGDVWYDYPYAESGKRRIQRIERAPSLTLYARHGDADIPLMRWPTTIGSWKKEAEPGGQIVYKYKNSDVGPRVWRRLVSGPSWFPPKSTPPEDLVELHRRKYRPKRDILGPSYASAFGLVMLIHEKPVQRGEETKHYDFGIRVHGSVSYRSINKGTSHGCHRLFNHLAVRLGDFLLKHRTHTVTGLIETPYRRSFTYKGRRMKIHLPSRGFGYTLEPPVPVEVLRGRVRGRTRRAPKAAFPLPAGAR